MRLNMAMPPNKRRYDRDGSTKRRWMKKRREEERTGEEPAGSLTDRWETSIRRSRSMLAGPRPDDEWCAIKSVNESATT